MFIRKKIKKSKNKEYIQYQLIESVRTSKGPRQEVILNMGVLDLSDSQLKNLSFAISMKLKGEQNFGFIEIDSEIIKLSEHYVNLIIQQRLNREGLNSKKQKDYKLVDINSIKSSEVRSIGLEALLKDSFDQYEINNILKKTGFKSKEIDYAKLLIASRAIHPSSERETVRFLNNDSALKEVLGIDAKVYDKVLLKTASLLMKKQSSLEQLLSQKAKDLFNLEESIILYDLTNTYFEGRHKNSTIAKHGRSKEKRSDCKLATLALVVDSEGFPKRSKILEGNISESKTLKLFLKDIKLMGLSKTIVMDAGIATESNIDLIKSYDLNYIAVSKKKYNSTFWEHAPEQVINLKEKNQELSIRLAKTKNESLLLCSSKAKEYRDNDIWSQKTKRFEEQLKKLNNGFNKKSCMKKYDKIEQKIGALKERYNIGNYYDIKIIKNGDIVQLIKYKKSKTAINKENKFGNYVLRTNRLDLSAKKISEIYRSLTTIETSFRFMKTDLGMRPNYHKSDNQIKAHIFISVLTYYFIISIIKRLRLSNCSYSWTTIRNLLFNHVRITTSFETNDNHIVFVKHCSKPNDIQKSIYSKLNIIQVPLPSKKIELTKVVPKISP